ncbi:DUF2065 domain-containing protein [Sneathiella sp.]|uniref:DUF2065 domain-containing protein n=1 Tax=Sneathiella sp. TaxID=1964365 RepID=UPI003565439E
MIKDLFLGAALVVFFEGILYALFPDGMKKMMMTAISTPSHILRIFGVSSAVLGLVAVWIIHG